MASFCCSKGPPKEDRGPDKSSVAKDEREEETVEQIELQYDPAGDNLHYGDTLRVKMTSFSGKYAWRVVAREERGRG